MCLEHERLRDEEKGAWAELIRFGDDTPKNPTAEQKKELERLTELANNASHAVITHVNACPQCNKQK